MKRGGGFRLDALASALVRAALGAFPAAWRARLSDEAGETVKARVAERRRAGGRWAALRLLLGEVLALVRMGALMRVDAHRAAAPARGSSMWTDLGQDVRYGVRMMVRQPVFAGLVVGVLALGIGANTAIFSVVHAVLLRPLTAAAPERLVTIRESNPEYGWTAETASPANMLDWREQVAAFEGVAAHVGVGNSTLTGEGEPEIVRSVEVTGNFFEVLGIQATHGRAFRDEETWDDAPRVVVLSDEFWTRRFGREPVLGRQLRFDGQDWEVVGILPPGLTYPANDIDVWGTMRWARADRTAVWFRRAHWLNTVARLAPGVSLEQAEAELQVVVERLQRAYPETNAVMGAHVHPLHRFVVGDVRIPLLLLQGAVLLLLLVACANAGNLMLVRAAGRRRELAVRAALGAGGARVARLVLVESMMLSGVGGVLGVALGIATVRALTGLLPPSLPGIEGTPLDVPVLTFALVLTLAAGALFGALPAWRAARAPLAHTMREGGRGGSDARATLRMAHGLVVAEIAIALILLLGAGLLIRSFGALRQVDPGFELADRITARFALPGARYDSAHKVVTFHEELLRRLRAAPGVRGAALSDAVPLTGAGWSGWTGQMVAEGWPPGQHVSEVAHLRASPEWRAVMGIPLLRGRDLLATDRSDTEPSVLINETLRRQYFADRDPIGVRIAFDRDPNPDTRWWRIVGVIADVHRTDLSTPPRAEIFHPTAQDPASAAAILLHGGGDAAAQIRLMRAAVAELDRDIPLAGIATLAEVYDRALRQDRFLLALLSGFAALALLLAALGVYGVASQAARRRTREIGIRVALGARRGDVAGLILRSALRLAFAGVALGLAGGYVVTRVMESVLFGVAPRDPVTFAAVPILLGLLALLATWLPARAATRVDPLVALRTD